MKEGGRRERNQRDGSLRTLPGNAGFEDKGLGRESKDMSGP